MKTIATRAHLPVRPPRPATRFGPAALAALLAGSAAALPARAAPADAPATATTATATAAAPPPVAADALGYPSRAPDLDALPGFRSPPPGYGEVPFWWWTGDPLAKDRLLWQIEELHRKGIAGVQVNYAHEDTSGWPTYTAEPPIFSDPWWEMWKFVAGECGKRDMGIGLSGYTLDWPNGRSLVSRTIYSDPDIAGRELTVASKTRVAGGKTVTLEWPADAIRAQAYPLKDGVLQPGGTAVPRSAAGPRVDWTPPEGDWEVWIFASVLKPGALNPLHPLAGRRVIEKFFQRFQDHAPNQSAKGLNYFFHDELQFGVGEHVWTDDFAEQFRARKGYDVFDALPALFADVGPRTPKARLDYMDVRMQLIQERYFIPIFDWHWSRGLIYGCDQGSRGLDPSEFGDYFGAVRWYTAPGHDTPGGHADLIKGKVSSSIAHLYQRPRVWLEGYHSLGWGATPARLMQATCENYIYGCNLLNLHGLYYSTHGSFWEWAPPCYHFRMPYWDHMGTFLKYFERLSYLMSQGVHQADIAILYPVAPHQAGLGAKAATDTAFDLGRRLFAGGRDFIFIDDESLARARIDDGRLHVAGTSYRALILPAMRAIRWTSLQKARALRNAGGLVIAIAALPEASDRGGLQDPQLDALVRDLFGATAAEAQNGNRPAPQPSPAGGVGAALLGNDQRWTDLDALLQPILRDVATEAPLKAVHRKIGPRDVYLLHGAPQNTLVTFRATGRPELWDPWTGDTRPLHVSATVPGGTRVRLPLGADEAQLIVFSPGAPAATLGSTDLDEVARLELTGQGAVAIGYATTPGRKTATIERQGQTVVLEGSAAAARTISLDDAWEFELQPTLDNRWGDFRLPIAEPLIGAEARIFRYAEEQTSRPGWDSATFDDSQWPRMTHGFGPQFWKLGPLPANVDTAALEVQLAALTRVDPAVPIELAGKAYAWTPYHFSWRWGKEGDPGHQGYHGLKENVTDDFLCLGKPSDGHNEIVYRAEEGGSRCFLWTCVVAPASTPTQARLQIGGLNPTAIALNGQAITNRAAPLSLSPGANPVLLRYDAPGRGHVVFLDTTAPQPVARTPLAMRWYDEPGLLRFDVRPGTPEPAGWYRFVAPPGLRGLTVVAHGTVDAWVDGAPCRIASHPRAPLPAGARAYRVTPGTPSSARSHVALRVRQDRGLYGGAALPEPIQLDCGPGTTPLGDWSQGSALENYSGGAWYRRTISLDALPPEARVSLDLGAVVATAEVRLNGKVAAIRVAPPWVVDLTPHVQPGENRLEILVYNTLANHYLTIPTRYRGDLRSGLLGPVRLQIQPAVRLARKQA